MATEKAQTLFGPCGHLKRQRLNGGSLGSTWASIGTLRALLLCAHVFGGENKTPFKSQPQLGFVESA